MRRLLASAVLIGAMFAGFAACGGSGITEAQSAGPTGPTGPQGPAGTNGVSGFQIVTQDASLLAKGYTVTSVSCPAGKSTLSGGWNFSSTTAFVMRSTPDGNGVWSFGINNQGTSALAVTFYVVCATTG